MMQKKKEALDIVNEILEDCILAYPISSFIISLYKQYQLRGSLSKKQLQGLYSKASGIEKISPGKLATLEALIKKMPTRSKSDLPQPSETIIKEDFAGTWIAMILAKYPMHKRVLFLNSKYENNEVLTTAEMEDLKRISQLIT